MFDFLFQKREGEMVSLLDVIGTNLEKIKIANMAEEKAIGMIAKAIAKSEIVITDGHEQVHDETYYRLNIQPNENQSGTDFWYSVAYRLISTGECIVAKVSGMYFVVTSYTADGFVINEKRYNNITITDGIDTYTLDRSFSASELLIFRYENDKIRAYRRQVLQTYNDTLQALTRMMQVANTPLFKFKAEANMAFASRDANGTEKRLTIEEVIDKLKSQLAGKDLAILKETRGTEIVYMDIPSKVSSADIKNLTDQINTECAVSYDIPEAVFRGSITEKSDATNEFITYAVQPPAEVISDELNAKYVGMDDYVKKGERVFVWLAHYKHIDVVDAATNLDKLRGIGFSLDEIRAMVGYPMLNTPFSQARALTKNYAAESGEIIET